MVDDANTMIYKKKMRLHLSKSMNVVKSWDHLGSVAVELICGQEYTNIPYYVDTNAYQLGYIFVQEASDVQCFCVAPQLKILGPIQDFLNVRKTNTKWVDKQMPAIKSTDDYLHYRVELDNTKSHMELRVFDTYFLNKTPDMMIEGDVTIDRTTHDVLFRSDWFGLITGVFIAGHSEIVLFRNNRERFFCIGEAPHTVFFKYEICRMNHRGTVQETVSEKIECKWLPVEERDMNALPLTKFVSQSSRTKS